MFIKWLGFDDENENTWESFKTFAEDSPELMHNYWLQHCQKHDNIVTERNDLMY